MRPARPKLLIATTNLGKLREYRGLLPGIPYEIISPTDAGITAAVEETGCSFEENARLKALAFARLSGLLTLSDDSGVQVDVLGGEPGVKSARYAGDNATDTQRVAFLLSKLKDVPWEKRTARVVCVIAIASPAGHVDIARGECRVIIATEPRGEYGFGYDPVLFVPEMGKTFAELPEEVKNRVSHRGRAAIKARRILLKMAGQL